MNNYEAASVCSPLGIWKKTRDEWIFCSLRWNVLRWCNDEFASILLFEWGMWVEEMMMFLGVGGWTCTKIKHYHCHCKTCFYSITSLAQLELWITEGCKWASLLLNLVSDWKKLAHAQAEARLVICVSTFCQLTIGCFKPVAPTAKPSNIRRVEETFILRLT